VTVSPIAPGIPYPTEPLDEAMPAEVLASVLEQVAVMADRLDTLNDENQRFGLVTRYLGGNHNPPYIPRGATSEFRQMAERSITNWLPLVSQTFLKALRVDGYRSPEDHDNDTEEWKSWQANGMDARQTIVHGGAINYGVGYVSVLPGSPTTEIRALDTTKVYAHYTEFDDEFPEIVIERIGLGLLGQQRFAVYTDSAKLIVERTGTTDPIQIIRIEYHLMGVCPVVRFRSSLIEGDPGVIFPLITLQDQINEAVFNLRMALQYASFRQRWVTGMAIPLDTDGKPVEPFKSAVNRLWVGQDPDTKFGDFAQTEVSGHIQTYNTAVRTLAAVAQISPNILTGDLINLAADALAQIESQTDRRIEQFELLFGESWENVFRLERLARGIRETNSEDNAAQVRWSESEARSILQTVNSLAVMVEKLGVPAQELWERIPGVTDGDVRAWKEAAKQADSLGLLTASLNAVAAGGQQGAPGQPPAAPGAPQPAAVA
jgi:hypothetical protein